MTRGLLSASGGILSAAAVGLFLLLIVLAPLPMGGNRDWAWSPMVVVVGGMSMLFAAGIGTRGGFEVSAEERGPLMVLLAAFTFFFLESLLQMSTLAPTTPSAWLYERARAILGKAHDPVPTLAIDASRNVLLKSMACGLLFLTARALFVDPRRARWLLGALALSALLVMTYALISQVSTNSCLVGSFLKKQGEYTVGYRCLMSGTFVNSNSFACFMGMGLVAVLALLLGHQPPRRRRHHDDGDEDFGGEESVLDRITGPRVALLALGFLFLGGLLISGSRAGLAASVLGILILLSLFMRGRWASRSQMGRALLIGGAVVVVIGIIAGGAMLQKLARFSEGSSTNRIYIWESTLEAIAQSPWWGWGRGAYPDIYSILQPLEIPQPNDLAHSTPLETIVELGIPGAVVAFLIVLVPWGVCLLGGLRSERERLLPATAFALTSVPILHSSVDFSLQMPAIAFVSSAVLGMGWAQVFARRAESSSERHRGPHDE
ncbi:MAG: O-antigen ligase family protein [Enhydrobacter sp.]|nr:MAG: O-antigen ligase family protein [Enhydrobacter sp.]